MYNDWTMNVQDDGTITVTLNDEARTYKIDEKIKEVNQTDEYVMIFVEGGLTYQFKFEENDFLVGDIYRTSTGDFMDTFAHHVFGEL